MGLGVNKTIVMVLGIKYDAWGVPQGEIKAIVSTLPGLATNWKICPAKANIISLIFIKQHFQSRPIF